MAAPCYTGEEIDTMEAEFTEAQQSRMQEAKWSVLVQDLRMGHLHLLLHTGRVLPL